jgi:hypothetical protein
VIAGHGGNQAFAFRGASVRAGQRGLGAGFVEKDQIVRDQGRVLGLPGGPALGILFGGDQTLFCA